MSAFHLALAAKRAGVRFVFTGSGQIEARGVSDLPDDLRQKVLARLGDVLSVVAEHSVRADVLASDAEAAPRKMILRLRREQLA